MLSKIREVVRGYPGQRDLELLLQLRDGCRVRLKANSVRLDITQELQRRLDELLGPGNVRRITSPPKPSSSGGNAGGRGNFPRPARANRSPKPLHSEPSTLAGLRRTGSLPFFCDASNRQLRCLGGLCANRFRVALSFVERDNAVILISRLLSRTMLAALLLGSWGTASVVFAQGGGGTGGGGPGRGRRRHRCPRGASQAGRRRAGWNVVQTPSGSGSRDAVGRCGSQERFAQGVADAVGEAT
jgi:hypothetical protein